MVLNEMVWRDPVLGAAAAQLAKEIRQGIETFGVVSGGPEVGGRRVRSSGGVRDGGWVWVHFMSRARAW